MKGDKMYTKGKWFNNGGQIYAQQGDSIQEICDVGLINSQSKEDTANTQRICLCVNSHDALLEACKFAETIIIEQHKTLESIAKGIAEKAGIKATAIPLPPTDILQAAIAEAEK